MTDKEPSSSSKPSDSTGAPQAGLTAFWAELKRRKVMRVAITYAVVAWLMIQISATVFPQLGIPEWAPRMVTLLLLVGFPIAVIIAWAFELTPDGVKTTKHAREDRQGEAASQKQDSKRNWTALGFAGLLPTLIFGALAIFFYFRSDTGPSSSIDKSIAVLPLANRSADPEQEYFADGMTEALITDLAQISALKVISRTSVMRYKDTLKSLPEIAEELEVALVLEGSVQRFGDRVLITAQLIEAATDKNLWAKRYEHDLSNILALQSEVAESIVKEIRIQLTPEEQTQLANTPTVNPEAHDAYLKGLFSYAKDTKEGFEKAIEFYEQALEKDPTYAPAYAAMARSYLYLGWWAHLPPREVFPKARVAALKALELDKTHAQAHLALGGIKMIYEFDWAGADKEFKRALDLSPNDSRVHNMVGWMFRIQGEHEASMKAFRTALELDPLRVDTNFQVGRAFYFARQYDQAIAHYHRMLELHPDHFTTHFFLSQAYAEKEMYEEAIEEGGKARALSGDFFWTVVIQADAYAKSGRTDEVRKIIEELHERTDEEHISVAAFAYIYAALGEKEQALDWLEKEYEERMGDSLLFLKIEPNWDSLRSEPRFIALLKKMGLDD